MVELKEDQPRRELWEMECEGGEPSLSRRRDSGGGEDTTQPGTKAESEESFKSPYFKGVG